MSETVKRNEWVTWLRLQCVPTRWTVTTDRKTAECDWPLNGYTHHYFANLRWSYSPPPPRVKRTEGRNATARSVIDTGQQILVHRVSFAIVLVQLAIMISFIPKKFRSRKTILLHWHILHLRALCLQIGSALVRSLFSGREATWPNSHK